ncbi:MAG: ATP-binding protein [Ignavibacteriales bacterium]|nr:ATP-binding protein [Ignavibacteriales bacterium]MCF8314486.1 ATP-binding protein [Ignavibacteriales bacterium]MCF8436477.1 ATP-binding protein [Ignavibacteriales bacterium]
MIVFSVISFAQFLFILFLLIFTIIYILSRLGEKRLKDTGVISDLIYNIRNNKYQSADEIKLPPELIEIEGEIKTLFLRTQNDIENLKKLEQIRTEFLGNVSHELRTPIFAIQGYLETLLSGAINDRNVNRSFLVKANIHTQNLNNLLNDLIDISMIESGQMRLSFRYFPLAEFLENLVSEYQMGAQKKNLNLVLKEIRPNLQVFGDQTRIRQAIGNLIQNAIKYTEKGEVEIYVSEENKLCRIFVKDTGIGIPEKDLTRVFERFYRVDKDRSRAVGGTGLGLAIVKHIVEAHGSKVIVESKWGGGSTFSFTLKK